MRGEQKFACERNKQISLSSDIGTVLFYQFDDKRNLQTIACGGSVQVIPQTLPPQTIVCQIWY
ncbi:hypothetical protein [Bacteroides faecichinchillae]|uniref:hypothetical protein n=1 Tax=Bacteroides faecichinchillae TaxID=871325 RepID=UPI00053B0FF0|nr:hypothetical protein [Bacteroides faecichinchillae]